MKPQNLETKIGLRRFIKKAVGKTESSEEWWDNFPNLPYITNDLEDKKLLKGLCKKWELKVEEFTKSHSTEGKFKDLTLALCHI